MSRFVLLFVLLLIPFAGCAHMKADPSGLLTVEDLALQRDQDLPAMTSSLQDKVQWQSFNEWRCFSVEGLEIIESAVKFNERDSWRKISLISIEHAGRLYEFNVPHEFYWDAKGLEREWRALFEGSPEVCFFAALVQDAHPDGPGEDATPYEIDRIKTSRGYWDVWKTLRSEHIKIDHSATSFRDEELDGPEE